MFQLHELGWNSFFQQHIQDKHSYVPARVIEEQRAVYRVVCEAGELLAELTGRFRHDSLQRADFPAVGDWVLIELRGGRATIHQLLPRKTRFSRKAAGNETSEQIVAANIDTVFLVTSMNADLNVRRIERYLTTIWDSGAQPVILLSKADLCDDIATAMDAVADVAFGVPIHVVSAVTGEGLEHLDAYLKPGRTVAVLGSSGVGKSTLINRLLGVEIQAVREIREDDGRGRHTTTVRRLFILPQGGMLIDTPGMRELQLWDGEGLSQVFDDIEALAEDCRFRDCRHESEPDCAVQAALSEGSLDQARFESYRKLRRESAYVARKQDVLARIEETKRWKRIHKSMRRHHK